MALTFSVSAPGKVILSGEHSVVYGKAAIAGVIDLRNTLQLEATSKTHIQLEFDLFPEPCTIAVADFNTLLAQLQPHCQRKELPAQVPHEQFVEQIGAFLGVHCAATAGDEEFRRTCLSAVYLLAGNLCASGCVELRHGFVVRFSSGLPKGAGLGSSASFGVCLGSAFYFYANYRLNANCIQHFNRLTADSAERAAILAIISGWAFCSERLMHGNPSGLDNTICTFGRLVKFYKQRAPTPVPLGRPLEILLINSGVSRSTRDQVDKVAALTRSHPALMDPLMQTMDAVVEEILQLLSVTGGGDAAGGLDFAALRRLIIINNDLLRAIGVSHPALESIARECDGHGMASKLTGAGGGGYAFALLPPLPLADAESDARLARLCEALEAAGFECKRTSVGGDGMVIEETTAGRVVD